MMKDCCAKYVIVTGCLSSCIYAQCLMVYITLILFHSLQLFTKLDCDEVSILEHTEQLLQDLGPDTSLLPEAELKSKGEGEESGLEHSDSRLLEEDTQDSETMELS